MNELDKALQSTKPREPSSTYLERGLAKIDEFDEPPRLVSPRWRHATIGLAFLLVASLALNGLNWAQGHREPSAERMLVSSELRWEGDLLIRETHYETSDGLEANHD